MKKVIVIGGSGFLGSHVADALSDSGYRVTIYDSKPTCWIRSDQQLIIGNVLDSERLDQAINGNDIVYNFAALADLNQAINQPLQTAEINILGNIHVLEACRLNKVKRFVYGSTVYVNSREGSFYRCSKQAAENYVEEYKKLYGVEYTILRYGSLYGPRSNETNGLFRIVKTAVNSGQIRFVGHPDSMREYIHVTDAARASVVALGDEFKNQSVVLTGQEPMQVVDMLKMLAEILGIPHESVEFIDGTYTGHYVRTPYAYQQKLGRKYIPPMHVDLGQGLLELIEEIQGINNNAV